MRLDARDLETDATIDCDVCIVGGGAAGISIALQLIDSGLDVCLLESGGEVATPETQDLYAGDSVGYEYDRLTSCRLRMLGGTTSHWGGFCRPMEAVDLQANDWMPRQAWPISYDTLRAHYDFAHGACQLGPFDYNPASIAARVQRELVPFDPKLGRSLVYRMSPPTRFGERFGDQLDAADNVRVYLHATMISVEVNDAGDHVEHLQCATLEGGAFRVRAGRYVLALGGIENARALLASNSRVPDGVANSSGLVGKGFMEHPHFYRAAYLLTDADTDLRFYLDDLLLEGEREDGDDVRVLGAMGPSIDALRTHQLPNIACRLRARNLDELEEDGVLGALPARELSPLLRTDADALVAYAVVARAEQRPLSDSRVMLADDRDALGVQRARLSWKIDDDDIQRVGRGMSLLGNALAEAGVGRLWLPFDGDGAYDPSGTIQGGCHHMGTTPFGDDPKRSVADADCRTHDCDNLYLAGSSLFPGVGFANPTLTIVALAARLAAHLKGDA